MQYSLTFIPLILIVDLSAEEEKALEQKLRQYYSILNAEVNTIQQQWQKLRSGVLGSPKRSETSDEGEIRGEVIVLVE